MATHPTAQIADGAQIHPDAEIGPWCMIGEQVKIGAGSKLMSNIYIEAKTTIGKNNTIFPFCVLGTAPQHTDYSGEGTELIIGDNNQIREYVVIHRAIDSHARVTKIGNHNMFMLGTHIGHDGQIGSHIITAPHALLGGHVMIEDYVTIGANAGMHQFTRIGKYAMLGAQSPARRDIIPFGLLDSPHGNLSGLNIVGMKRRGFTREEISHVQSAYQILFLQNTTMEEGLAMIQEKYSACKAVAEIIRFLTEKSLRHYARPAQKAINRKDY